MTGIESALTHSDFEAVRSQAHWLKGSGGTVGFDQLTQSARQLEVAAKDNDEILALEILHEIQSIRSRIVKPTLPRSVHESPKADTRKNQPSHLNVASTSQCPSIKHLEQSDTTPIQCALPLDDEDYRMIVVDFIERLDARLLGMLSLAQNGHFEELQNEAHWLKGAGGTVGYAALTNPAKELMLAAEQGDIDGCQEALRDLLQIRQRLVIPQTDHPVVLPSTQS